MEYDKEIFNKTGIFVFDNAVSPQLCDDLIEYFTNNKHLHEKGKTGGGYNPNVKNSIDWHIKNEDFDNKLVSILNIATSKVLDAYPSLKRITFKYCGLQLQYSEKNKGFFRWHSDNDEGDKDYFRVLAPIFYLNNVYEGGETEFIYQDIKVKPKKGRLVIFPAIWTYYHRGIKPRSNDKYIITTFALAPRNGSFSG